MLSRAPQKASLEARMLPFALHCLFCLEVPSTSRKRIRLLVFCSTQTATGLGVAGRAGRVRLPVLLTAAGLVLSTPGCLSALTLLCDLPCL